MITRKVFEKDHPLFDLNYHHGFGLKDLEISKDRVYLNGYFFDQKYPDCYNLSGVDLDRKISKPKKAPTAASMYGRDAKAILQKNEEEKLSKNYLEKILRVNLKILTPTNDIAQAESVNVNRTSVQFTQRKRSGDLVDNSWIVWVQQKFGNNVFDMTYFLIDPITFRILVRFKPSSNFEKNHPLDSNQLRQQFQREEEGFHIGGFQQKVSFESDYHFHSFGCPAVLPDLVKNSSIIPMIFDLHRIDCQGRYQSTYSPLAFDLVYYMKCQRKIIKREFVKVNKITKLRQQQQQVEDNRLQGIPQVKQRYFSRMFDFVLPRMNNSNLFVVSFSENFDGYNNQKPEVTYLNLQDQEVTFTTEFLLLFGAIDCLKLDATSKSDAFEIFDCYCSGESLTIKDIKKIKGITTPQEQKKNESIKLKHKEWENWSLKHITFIKKEGKVTELLMNFSSGVIRDNMHYHPCLTIFAKLLVNYEGEQHTFSNLRFSEVHQTLGYPSWKYLGSHFLLYVEESLDYRKQTDRISIFRIGQETPKLASVKSVKGNIIKGSRLIAPHIFRLYYQNPDFNREKIQVCQEDIKLFKPIAVVQAKQKLSSVDTTKPSANKLASIKSPVQGTSAKHQPDIPTKKTNLLPSSKIPPTKPNFTQKSSSGGSSQPIKPTQNGIGKAALPSRSNLAQKTTPTNPKDKKL